MFVDLQDFFDNYRIKNGLQPNETVMNRASMRLKRETRELKSIIDILTGVPLSDYSATYSYEIDEYVLYSGENYRSRINGNIGNEPITSDLINWEHITLGDDAVNANYFTTNNSTESDVGTISIATQTEVDDGSLDTKAVTPLKLKSNLDAELIKKALIAGDSTQLFEVATPVNDDDAANKKYVDDNSGLSEYNVITADENMVAGEGYLCDTSGVALSVGVTAYELTLPTLTTNSVVYIADGNGNAQNRPVKVNGLIDNDAGGLVLDVNYFDIKLIFNGTYWSVAGK